MRFQDPLQLHFRLKESQKRALKKLGIETVRDLLFHFPFRYEDASQRKMIGGLTHGTKAVIYGTLRGLTTRKAFRKRIPMSEGYLEDASGRIKLIWFNQPYIAKMHGDGTHAKVEGAVAERNGTLYIANPVLERVSSLPSGRGGLFSDERQSASDTRISAKEGMLPVYPESRGVSSLWSYFALQKILASGMLKETADPLPRELLKRYNLPSLTSALHWIHAPRKRSDAEAARKRFAFEEVFLIQLSKQRERARCDALPAFAIEPTTASIRAFTKRFSFTPTNAQHRAVAQILADLNAPHPMSRLLEGDVGSGKTYVAAVTAHAVATAKPKGQTFGNLQVAYMAPTEILATQLFENFISFFKGLPIQIGLITGGSCRKFPSKVSPEGWTDISRPQLLTWVANGEIPILIGTHALIQKSVTFKHLAYVIIDEQHRFGTHQRAKLAKKGGVLPHLLSMTATPIPRTLALTIYGDLDLTLLDEMPEGRKRVETMLVTKEKRDAIYEEIRARLKDGRQLYVICPRIAEPDETKANALRAKSVKEEAERLKHEVFAEFKIDALHGKMTSKEKDAVMKRFADHKTDILVATSVVEVGVNVPNATMIVIEGAERFGLAQLHQLRGRVLRSSHQAYCYLFPDALSRKSIDRLKAVGRAKNGFELAELDLTLRGAGQLAGDVQWGISDVGMEALQNLKMVEAARSEAHALIASDPTLDAHPALRELADSKHEIHFE